MKHIHNAIESPVFDAYRKKQIQIKKAIELLKENDYQIYKEKKV
tara:strand:+ start:546 stop:677 length:132 start_codon:yes stop_codon:yes gene_type:complete